MYLIMETITVLYLKTDSQHLGQIEEGLEYIHDSKIFVSSICVVIILFLYSKEKKFRL